jgi:hypothetical protein
MRHFREHTLPRSVALRALDAPERGAASRSGTGHPARLLRQSCEAGAREHSIRFMLYLALPHYPLDEATRNNRPFFLIVPCSHNTTRSNFSAGVGLLTVRRVRDIMAPCRATMS